MLRTSSFSTYLKRLMMRSGFDELTLAREMGYRTAVPVSRWCDGTALPFPADLPLLAKIFGEDVITVAMGWLMAQSQELEFPIRREILEPRGINYPEIG